MKNIIRIFVGDIRRIRSNVIALITVIGLIIIPSLYAWFNIAASWDPYKNTGNLQVAVANLDAGYTGDLLPVSLNLGDQVISTLHESTMLDWVFTDESDAIEGTKSGKYYAAIIIPQTFSEDMMSLFSTDVQHSALIYYSNQKKSAIAPKVTDKTTTKLQNQIDQIFTSAITDIGVDLMEGLSGSLDADTTTALMSNLLTNLDQISTDLDTTAAAIDAFADMTDSLNSMLTTTTDFLGSTSLTTTVSDQQLDDIDDNVQSLSSAISSTAGSISTMLDQAAACYSDVESQIDSTFESLGGDTESVKSGLAGLDSEVSAIVADYTDFRDTLSALRDSLPEDSTLLRTSLSNLIGRLDQSIASQQTLSDKLVQARNNVDSAVADADSTRSELKELANSTISDLSSVRSDYNGNVKSELESLYSSLKSTVSSVNTILDQLDSSVSDITDLTDDASDSVSGLKDALTQTAALLEDSADQVQEIRTKVAEALESNDLTTLESLLGSDPTDISSFISAPVVLNEIELYPVENYGSAMAPFYSVLAIWVGSIILVAMLKVNLNEERLEELDRPRNYQLYFGRYLMFMILGLLQALLLGLGDLFFLKIQCMHPGLFLLDLLVTGFVFSLFMYTLTISFGDIGKAIAVVLLVIQLGGSGGTFPSEMTPKFFRMISPLLPFTHAMNAMRECIAGFYQNNYWIELGKMGFYVLGCLALGLVLRAPVIRLNRWITEQMEKTRFM